jgi:hypothetical protein
VPSKFTKEKISTRKKWPAVLAIADNLSVPRLQLFYRINYVWEDAYSFFILEIRDSKFKFLNSNFLCFHLVRS